MCIGLCLCEHMLIQLRQIVFENHTQFSKKLHEKLMSGHLRSCSFILVDQETRACFFDPLFSHNERLEFGKNLRSRFFGNQFIELKNREKIKNDIFFNKIA